MELNKIAEIISPEVLTSFLRLKGGDLPVLSGEVVISAIDIGYGYTKYTTGIGADGKVECDLFPSIAPMSPQEDLSGEFFVSRDTKKILSGGVVWEVGPDVYEITTRNDVRALHENYTQTEQWKVLFLGALAYQGHKEIDYLVLGLPVSNMSKKAEIEKVAKGTHTIGDVTVTVHNVMVVPQPLGSLYNYAINSGDFTRFQQTNTLIIDPGYLTFDFLVTKGFAVNPHRSGARPGGMSSILNAIASSIAQTMSVDYDDLNQLDVALDLKNYGGVKGSRPIYIYGEEVDLNDHIKNTVPVIDSSLNFMLNKAGDSKDIAQIIMAGGPNKIFEKSVSRQFPRHKILNMDDGIFSNVIGFYLWGLMVAFGNKMKDKAETKEEIKPASN